MIVQEKVKQAKLKILAIDDEETVLRLYSKLLKQEGHEVTCVMSGADALERVETENFDLIFLDLKLPDIDGTELLGRMRQCIEWVPVIIVTGNPTIESSIEAIKAGIVTEYIIKPFDTKDLMMIVRTAVDKARLTIENRRLVNKLERANRALMERVDQLESFAKITKDNESKMEQLEKYVKKLEKKLK